MYNNCASGLALYTNVLQTEEECKDVLQQSTQIFQIRSLQFSKPHVHLLQIQIYSCKVNVPTGITLH
jgi:hypothetical protein